MDLLGIHLIPFDTPLQKHLQAFAAVTWLIFMSLGGVVGAYIALLITIYTSYWWLVVLYFVWIWFIEYKVPETGGRRSQWARSWTWWKYLQDYFPLKLVKLPEVELDRDKNYLFCVFPHGLLPTGAFNAFVYEYSGYKEYFPHHIPYVATMQQQFVLPLGRELILSLGGISVSSKSIEYVLSKPEGGRVCVLAVGGAKEAYYCKPGDYRLNLRSRKGFVRLALRNGSPLVPVFSFGEIDLYDQVDGPILRKFQEILRKWIFIAPVIPIGRGFFQSSFGLIPRNRPVTTVVGRPIEVPKVENPTAELIDEYHTKFIEGLTQLFEEHKHKYLEHPHDTKLIIT